MAWTQQANLTAKVTDDDVRIEFFAESGKLFAVVKIEPNVAAHPEHVKIVRLQCAGTGHDAGLTSQERTDLVAVLRKIRDAALPIAGYSGP